MDDNMVWIPAVPLPLFGIGNVRCWVCDTKFRGRDRRHRYEIHYRREHERRDSDIQMAVTRDEAKRIYDEVQELHALSLAGEPRD